MSQANDQKVDDSYAVGWVLIAHSEGNAEPATLSWCYSAAEVLKAVKAAVWGLLHEVGDEEGAQAEAIAVTLMTEGWMRFEGDPPLQLVRIAEAEMPLRKQGFSQWLLVGQDEGVAGHSPHAILGIEKDYNRRYPASAPFRWLEMVERYARAPDARPLTQEQMLQETRRLRDDGLVVNFAQGVRFAERHYGIKGVKDEARG